MLGSLWAGTSWRWAPGSSEASPRPHRLHRRGGLGLVCLLGPHTSCWQPGANSAFLTPRRVKCLLLLPLGVRGASFAVEVEHSGVKGRSARRASSRKWRCLAARFLCN